MRLVTYPVLSLLTFLTPTAFTQTEPKHLTAREIFYAPEPSAPAKPMARADERKKKKTGDTGRAHSGQDTSAASSHKPSSPDGTAVVTVSNRLPALGVRYSILKRIGEEEFKEVSPTAVFKSGDRIKLAVEVNGDGYLYVINRGPKGAWKPLYPNADSGSNRVSPNHRYDIPASPSAFLFDENPGEERLFVVLSRNPEPNLEDLVQSFSRPQQPASTPSPEKTTPSGPVLTAENLPPADDALVSRLRNAYTRDLVVEAVDEKTPTADAPSGKKEQAIYAVNPSGKADDRVVADVVLKHR